MAQIKITELTEANRTSSDDMMLVVDSPLNDPLAKKITSGNLLNSGLPVNELDLTKLTTGFSIGGGGKSIVITGNTTLSGTPYTPGEGIVAVSDGGTGLGGITKGSVLATNATNDNAIVPITSMSGLKYLKNNDGTISWDTISSGVEWGGTVPEGGTGAASFASGYLLKGNSTSPLSPSSFFDNGTLAAIGSNAVVSGAILALNGAGSALSSVVLPRDTTEHRPTGVEGMVRYNTTTKAFEGYSGVSPAWASLGGSDGTVPQGGTGAATFASGFLLKGNTTSAISSSIISDSGTQVAIASGGAVSGALLTLNGSGATASSLVVPRDTTANRPAIGVEGMLRYNSTSKAFEGYGGTSPIWGIFSNGTVAQGGTGVNSLSAGFLLKGNNVSPVSASIISDTGTQVAVGSGSVIAGSVLTFNGAGASYSSVVLPRDTEANKPSGVEGMIRYNTTSKTFEGCSGAGATWGSFGGNDGTVPKGGTGATAFTQNFLLKGNAANALSSSIIADDGSKIAIGSGGTTAGAIASFNGTGATGSSILLPRDTDYNRPSSSIVGMMRYNITTGTFEGYQGLGDSPEWSGLARYITGFGTQTVHDINDNPIGVGFLDGINNATYSAFTKEESRSWANTGKCPSVPGGQVGGWEIRSSPTVYVQTKYTYEPTSTDGFMEYANVHSKILNTGGWGRPEGAETSTSSYHGFVHEVENKGGSGDCAALYHLYYTHGQTSTVKSETSGFSYNYLIGGHPYINDAYASLSTFPATGFVNSYYLALDTGYSYTWNGTSYVSSSAAPNEGLARYYNSVIEGQQYFINGGANSFGHKGWLQNIHISNNFATGGPSAGHFPGYEFISAVNGQNLLDGGASGLADPAYDQIYADKFLTAAGKWKSIFSVNHYGMGLTIGEVAIDLYDNVHWGSPQSKPALKISKDTFIDLCGEYPGSFIIGALNPSNDDTGGVYILAGNPAVLGAVFSKTATSLNIGGVLKTLSVDGSGFVKAS